MVPRQLLVLRLLAALAVGGFALGCDEENSSKPDDPLDHLAPVADFTLEDVNPSSPTLHQSVALRDFVAQGCGVFLLFFLDGQCSTCRVQWRQMSLVIDSLRAAGMTSVGGCAINEADAWYYAPFFGQLEIEWPALQDTLIVVGEEEHDAIGHALDCETGRELLILALDTQGTYRVHRRTTAFPGEYGELDLLLGADRAQLVSWIKAADAARAGGS